MFAALFKSIVSHVSKALPSAKFIYPCEHTPMHEVALLTAPPVALLALAFFSTYSIARGWLHRRMPGYFPALPYFAACWFLSLFLALSTFAVV